MWILFFFEFKLILAGLDVIGIKESIEFNLNLGSFQLRHMDSALQQCIFEGHWVFIM